MSSSPVPPHTIHAARGTQGFLYSRKMPGLYHKLRICHDLFLAHSFHLYSHPLARHMIFCHSIHALLHGLFRCTCLIFIPKQKLIPFVAVIQMFVLHRMTCSIVKNFFGLNAYLAENTVPPNNSYWVLTSFVAMATAVQLAHTRISDKEILNAKLETAERWRGRLVGRAVGHHAIMQLRRAFGVRVKVCVVLHSQVTDFVVQLTAWHHNAGAPAAARLRKAYHRSVSTLFT